MRRKVLIVEEEAVVADSLTRRLRTRGYSPMRAFTVEQALMSFDGARPDLVIVSLTLADDGGLEVCRAIRGRPLGALIPIVLLGTGPNDSVGDVAGAIAVGADQYFVKPGGLDTLIKKIEQYIGDGDVDGAGDVEPAASASSPQDDPLRGARDDFLQAINRVIARRPAKSETLRPPEGVEPPAPPPPVDAPGLGFVPPATQAMVDEADWEGLLQSGRSVPLNRRGIGEIIAAAHATRLTGRIELAAAGVLRRVFFDDGQPVYADSSAATEDLVSFLAGEGRIARQSLLDARRRAAERGLSPEEVLIESGYLPPDTVYAALRGFVIERVLALFALEAGEAMAISGGARPLDPVDLGVHPGRLILDGVRRKYGRLRLYRVFGTSRVVPRPRLGITTPVGLKLRPDEEAVWKSCDGQRTALEVSHAARVREIDTLAILFALATLDLVEPPDGRRPGNLPPLDAATVERAGPPQSADELPGYSELVDSKYAEVQTADYHTILNVPRTATSAEIQASWEQLRHRFDPHRVRRDGPLWSRVVAISAVLDDAHAVLSDPRLRTKYEHVHGGTHVA